MIAASFSLMFIVISTIQYRAPYIKVLGAKYSDKLTVVLCMSAPGLWQVC